MKELNLDTLVLESGIHAAHDAMCVMEAVAYVAGEPWSDSPECACPVISAFLKRWNDDLNNTDRQLLKPFIPRLVTSKVSSELEDKRTKLISDWFFRVQVPAWLDLAGLKEHALGGRQQGEKYNWAAARDAGGDAAWAAAKHAARDAAGDAAWAASKHAARAAAWAAAGDAAWAAAWDAAGDAAWVAAVHAAWNAAWNAAWSAARAAAVNAARTAAWAAAVDAARTAAWAAAVDAAWAATVDAAGDAAAAVLRPMVETLQKSAFHLIEQCLEIK